MNLCAMHICFMSSKIVKRAIDIKQQMCFHFSESANAVITGKATMKNKMWQNDYRDKTSHLFASLEAEFCKEVRI